MEKVYQIIAIIALALFVIITIGGSIWAQAFLWKNAWYLAVPHLLVVGLAVPSFRSVVRWLINYIDIKSDI